MGSSASWANRLHIDQRNQLLCPRHLRAPHPLLPPSVPRYLLSPPTPRLSKVKPSVHLSKAELDQSCEQWLSFSLFKCSTGVGSIATHTLGMSSSVHFPPNPTFRN